jgi:hypothetical protein
MERAMLTIWKVSKGIFSDLTKASRLLVIVVPVAALVVGAIVWARPTVSGDEVAAIAAVPLLISYMMIRGVMWAASRIPDATDEERKAFEQGQKEHPPQLSISGTLAIAFVLGVWWVVTGSLSAVAYWGLGLNVAFSAVVSSIKWTLLVVSTAAVLICLTTLCRTWLLKIAKFSHDVFDDPFSFFHGRA